MARGVPPKIVRATAEAPVSDRPDLTPEEAKERANRRAKISQALSRGLANSKLELEKEPGIKKFWVRDNEQDITKFKSIGAEPIPGPSPDSLLKQGDLVAFQCDEELSEILDELRMERVFSHVSAGPREFKDAEHASGIKVFDSAKR